MRIKSILILFLIFIIIHTQAIVCDASSDLPEFSEDEFMIIIQEADAVMNFYIRPEYKGSSDMIKLISLVGGGFDFYSTQTKNGRLMTRLTGGLARPKAYMAFLNQYFTDDVINSVSAKGTFLDWEEDQVYWFAVSYPDIHEENGISEYEIIEFNNERVICRLTVTVNFAGTNYTDSFDNIYQHVSGKWQFTKFATKRDLMANIYSEIDSIERTSTITEYSSSLIAVLIVFASVIYFCIRKKKNSLWLRRNRNVICMLVVCVMLIGLSSCISDNHIENIPAATSAKNEEATNTGEIASFDLPATPTLSPTVSTNVPYGELLTEGDWQYTISYSRLSGQNEAKLIKYIGNEIRVTLPGKIGGVSSVSLSEDAFSESENTKQITEIVNIDNVVVKKGALNALSNLESLTIAELDSFEQLCDAYFRNSEDRRLKNICITSATSIPEKCFLNAVALERIELAESVSLIGEEAFMNCTNLKSVSFENVKSIGSRAFYGCSALESIKLSGAVIDIGEDLFSECVNLQNLKIDSTEIRFTADNNKGLGRMPALNTVEFADNVTEIPAYLLYNSGIKGDIKITGSRINSIGRSAFEGNWMVTDITFPESIVVIEKLAFKYCMSLSNIDLPEGLKTISDGAFQHCCSLESVHIPDSVEYIGTWAFGFCDHLKNIYIPEQITEIPEAMFYGCADLQSFSHNCSKVGDRAFFFCTGLEKCEFGENAELGDQVFYFCFNLYPDVYYSIHDLY